MSCPTVALQDIFTAFQQFSETPLTQPNRERSFSLSPPTVLFVHGCTHTICGTAISNCYNIPRFLQVIQFVPL